MSFAYTAPTAEGYPPYVNISRISPTGDVKVIVRGAPHRDMGGMLMCGHHVECVVPADEWPSVTPLNEAMIRHMVNRFLCWRLPENFHPDAGISFKPTFNDHLPEPSKHQPVGTNLFDYTQAEAMVRYMLEGMVELDA